MIHYIFEDEQDDILSILFRYSYDAEYCKRYFHYSRGNGNIIRMAESILNNNLGDKVAIFIDMIPGNESCSDLYKMLTRFTKRHLGEDRVLVFPVVCSEYYFIRSLAMYTNLLERNNDIEIALNKGNYTKSNIYLNSFNAKNGKNKCKNFEKFCKFILLNYLYNCARHSRGHGESINEQYGLYYTKDCSCSDCKYNCLGNSLETKSKQLLSMWDCIPGNSIHDGIHISWQEAKLVINKLVDDYNSMCKKYDSLGVCGDTAIYKEIKSIWRNENA